MPSRLLLVAILACAFLMAGCSDHPVSTDGLNSTSDSYTPYYNPPSGGPTGTSTNSTTATTTGPSG